MTRYLVVALALSATPIAAHAGPAAPTAAKGAVAEPRLLELRLDPPEVVLDRPNAPRQLLVTGRYSDGSLRDLTSQAQFVSLQPRIAPVDAHGLVTPREDGRAPIAAKFGGRKASGAVVVRNARQQVRWSFPAQIAPILTSAGCNGGSCHGSPVGKGGFRLSLFNTSPELDYQAIAREGGRRVNPADPAASLILRKPSVQIAHKGGLRFKVDSREYRTLEAWIRAGAPEGVPTDPRVVSLDVLPHGRVLPGAGQKQQLVVLAKYSDGTTEDVTHVCLFSSNDEGVAEVDRGAEVTAVNQGEAPIMVRYAGLLATALVGVTTQPEIPGFPRIASDNLVDRFVFPKLQALHIQPAPLCSDEEFLRRAYLDVTATLPTVEEARSFLEDNDPGKRTKLVDLLLARPEYADYQAMLWADRLRSNSRFHRTGGVKAYQAWLKETFLANMPLDEFARKLVTATGQNYTDGPSNFWGNYDVISRPDEVAPQASQLFLGVRMQCAQCHNHPFERWTQDDFYSLAAVFGQVKGRGTKKTQEFELYLDPKATVENPLTQKVMEPHALDSPVFTAAPTEDVRVKFADWLTSPQNPYFARAMVNRVWKQFMGRGLVEPVDDMRATNPATHPELLDALARELINRKFDQKQVIRLILTSRAYQASSQPDPANVADRKYYSRAYPKRMAAEVYFDAVCQITGKPETFTGWPEAKRAVQLPENRFPSYFLDVFGRPNRLVICDREEEGTISQALNLINGKEIQSRVADKGGTLAKLLASGKPDDAILDELFLGTFSRFPKPEERSRLARQMSTAPNREEALQDVLWAMLSAREFQFNH